MKQLFCEHSINEVVDFVFCYRPAAEWHAVGASGSDIYERV